MPSEPIMPKRTDDGALPDPLVPSDIDLRSLPWMPFYLDALHYSEFIATCSGEGFKAAFLLWGACWRNVPAGSLPNDTAYVRKMCGLSHDDAFFQLIKDEALHGFVLCSDNRLYHRFLAPKAAEQYEVVKRQRAFRDKEKQRVKEYRSGTSTTKPNSTRTEQRTGTPNVRDREREREENINPDVFEALLGRVLQNFPGKKDKGSARKVFKVALKKLRKQRGLEPEVATDLLVELVEQYRTELAAENWKNPKYASSWLNSQPWDDEPAETKASNGHATEKRLWPDYCYHGDSDRVDSQLASLNDWIVKWVQRKPEDRYWSLEMLGPRPGEHGCYAPPAMRAAFPQIDWDAWKTAKTAAN